MEGLKLHDLKSKDKSLKLSWVPKLLSNTEFATYIQGFFDIPIYLLFGANISPKDIRKVKIDCPFLKNVLQYWSQVNYNVPKNKNQILNQFIWYNSCSSTTGWLYSDRLYHAGITKISHVFCEQKKGFLDCQQLQQKYHVNITFLELYKIMQSIPRSWRIILRAESNEYIPYETWYEIALKGSKISREIYWSLIDQMAPATQGSMLLWSQEFNRTYTSKQWSSVCKFSWKITLSTKLRLFQYKITQRCLVTNIKLYYYGIVENKNCTFCKRSPESITHLFWECEIIRNFWTAIFDMLKYRFNDNRLNFNTPQIMEKVMLNKVTSNPLDYINTLVLIAKRHIYVTRCEHKKPSLQVYFSQVLEYKSIEQYIAIKNNKIEKHEIKWPKCPVTI